MWGSRTCSSRGSELVDVIHQLGLQVLNTGSFTFVRRTGRPSCSAIDISLASEGARYDWATQPDSWDSDHLPIIITPVGGKIRRTRQCTTIRLASFPAAAPRGSGGPGFPGPGSSSSTGSDHPV
ncbi:hypothetical protein MTO96_034572 [Rhipicephalus appendiculatus]